MYRRIEQYLEKMCKKIQSKTVRKSAYEEIKSHLLDRIDELESSGIDKDKAIRTVLENATNPIVLGKKLNIAHRPLVLRYPLVLLSSSISVIGLIGLIICSNYFANNYLNPRRLNQSDEITFEKKFKDDLKILSKVERSYSREKNAHFYLSGYSKTIGGCIS